MIRIVRNPPHHFVITNLPACAPAIAATQTPIPVDPAVESITDMDYSLQSARLDSDMVHAGHDALIEMDSLSDRDAAHVFPALDMAQMDAGISCWDCIYQYTTVQPWQADPQIAGPVGNPNHFLVDFEPSKDAGR